MATFNITGGDASDAMKALLQTSFDRSNSLFGQSTGLSPEAMSALRTQGTSGISNQYNSAAQAVNAQLLRRGMVGQGALPSSGGDISRAYQPLYTAMEQAKSKAQTDTILANEALKQQTLYQNNQLAQGALNSATGQADQLAGLEPGSYGKILGSSLLSSLANPGGGILGGLFSGTGTNSTGSHGVLGDVFGKVAGNDMGGYTREAIGAAGTAAAPALGGAAPATGIMGSLGLGGGAGLLGLGAATIPVIGGAVAGIALLAKHFFGNGGDRLAANDLTGNGGVHQFWTQATEQLKQLPPDQQAAAADARDRQMEEALVAFSKRGFDEYYQAKQTLRQFAGYSSVRALLG